MRPGAWGWVSLFAHIAVLDAALSWMKKSDKERYATLSGVFNDNVAHELNRWPITVGWSVLTLHLFKYYLPEDVRKLDPITGFAELLEDILIIPVSEKRHARISLPSSGYTVSERTRKTRNIRSYRPLHWPHRKGKSHPIIRGDEFLS